MFSFVAMLRGMIVTTTQATGRAILFNLLIMCIILILVSAIIALIIGPTTTASSDMLRTLASAPSSVVICLISLKIGFAVSTILSTILLICTSLKSIVLKLVLIVLRSLASASLCEASKLLITTLTIERSAATIWIWGSIIIIVVIIVRALISIVFICLLGFWWVLSMTLRFSFRFTSTSGLFWFCAFKWWGYFPFFFVHRMCDMRI